MSARYKVATFDEINFPKKHGSNTIILKINGFGSIQIVQSWGSFNWNGAFGFLYYNDSVVNNQI
jgi:hypothetical protein